MEKIEIFIFGKDEPYAQALSCYMAGTDTGFNACLLRTEEEANSKIAQQELVLSDVLLSGPYLLLSESREAEERGVLKIDEEESPCIYKYLPADMLADEIRYQIAARRGKALGAAVKVGQHTRLIALATGAGGRGNSAMAVALCRCLAESKAKVLYLSLEPISATRIYSGQGACGRLRSISDYVYKVLSGKTVLSENGFTYQDDYAVRYFYDEEGINPLVTLSVEEAEKVFTYLIEAEPYDYILADVPFLAMPAAACLLGYSNRLLLTGDESPASKFKNQRLREILNSGKETMPLRIREVINRWNGLNPEKDEDTFYIKEERQAFCHTKENTEILPHTNFTDGIRTICQWIKEG